MTLSITMHCSKFAEKFLLFYNKKWMVKRYWKEILFFSMEFDFLIFLNLILTMFKSNWEILKETLTHYNNIFIFFSVCFLNSSADKSNCVNKIPNSPIFYI